jgi:hypothetical protein
MGSRREDRAVDVMWIASVILSLGLLACLLWLLGLVLDVLIRKSPIPLPPETKPIVLGLVFLVGLVQILRGWRVPL